MPRVALSPIYFTEEAADTFGPLRVLLGAVSAAYAKHEVRLPSPVQSSSEQIDPQETVLVRNKIGDLLSRVATLEADFSTLPGDVQEHTRKYKLIWYVILPFETRIDFVLASSRTSRGNCGHYELQTMFKTMKMCSGFLKICGRPSPITGFVHHLGTISDIDRENRWCNERQAMSKDAKG